MSELVLMHHDEPMTTSLAISDGVQMEHKSVLQLIRNHVEDLAEFGGVAFEMRPFETNGGKQWRDVYFLNEQQATLLVTFMRNSPIVIAFKKALVRAFFELRDQVQLSAPSNPPFVTNNLSHGADLAVAAERTFRSFIRAGRTAGLPFPQALRIANEQTIARTGMDMLSQLSVNLEDVAVDLAAKQKPINPVDPEIDALMLAVSSWAEKADPDRFYCMDEIVAEVAGVKFNSHRGRSFACRIGPMLKRAGFRSKRAYLMDMQRNVWYRG